MRSKKTLLLVFTTIVTVILAVVAVITSLKLREYATVPIAPNAPESEPMAADYACQTSFTVGATTVACQGACTKDSECPSGLSCTGNKCVNPSCAAETNCVCPSASPTPTPTATPVPNKCNIECNPNVSDTGCASGLTCEPNSRRCRNPSCTDREDCSCPVNTCNTECNPNAGDTGCKDGLVCEPNSRRCRKAACTGEESCSCPSPTPVATAIPKAGNTTPGLVFLLLGGVLLVLGVVTATAL